MYDNLHTDWLRLISWYQCRMRNWHRRIIIRPLDIVFSQMIQCWHFLYFSIGINKWLKCIVWNPGNWIVYSVRCDFHPTIVTNEHWLMSTNSFLFCVYIIAVGAATALHLQEGEKNTKLLHSECHRIEIIVKILRNNTIVTSQVVFVGLNNQFHDNSSDSICLLITFYLYLTLSHIMHEKWLVPRSCLQWRVNYLSQSDTAITNE